ncbi:MAG: PilT/PilU family type 4a pilus ATPase [Clostridia bacterium]|nr:PilT/PilU family type 4a pilus ATPase [Clostridia bacterium]
MGLTEMLRDGIQQGGSDIFIIPGSPVMAKCHGKMVPLSERILPKDSETLIQEAYALAGREMTILTEDGDDDFSFAIRDVSRFRCNAYNQRGTLAATCRAVTFGLPDPEAMGIPKLVMQLASLRNGMILVTGPAGSGKSTTMACMINQINHSREGHIITIEDPIEYLHHHEKSLVSQREVPNDSPTFERALRAALRQAPDVIMLGEMRDLETIKTAITAAETGHLLVSSLHTIGASKTVDRIIDTFPPEQQAQIRVQLSMILKAVVSQRLVPTVDGHQTAVFEVMTVNAAIQNLIRDGRTHQIDNAIFAGNNQEMLSMDNELARLCKAGRITRDVALSFAMNPETLQRRI